MPGIAALLVNVGPIFIAILAGMVLREGFPRLLLAGCAVAFIGAALIGAGARVTLGARLGAVLCIVAALAYAGGVIAQKPALRDASPLAVTWLACVVGAIACLPFARRWSAISVAPLGRPLDGLSRPRTDGGRLSHLGLRALAHRGRADGLDHLPRAARGVHSGLDSPRRGAALARGTGRSPVPGRGGCGPLAASAARAPPASLAACPDEPDERP